jgi:hypothetical protein
MARDLVVWAPTPARDGILAKIGDFVAQQTALEQTRIIAGLQKKGIDWNPGPAPRSAQPGPAHGPAQRQARQHVIGAGETPALSPSPSPTRATPRPSRSAPTRQRLQLLRRARAAVRPHRPGPDPQPATLKLSVSEHELSRTDRIEWQLFDQHGSAVAPGSQMIDRHQQRGPAAPAVRLRLPDPRRPEARRLDPRQRRRRAPARRARAHARECQEHRRGPGARRLGHPAQPRRRRRCSCTPAARTSSSCPPVTPGRGVRHGGQEGPRTAARSTSSCPSPTRRSAPAWSRSCTSRSPRAP